MPKNLLIPGTSGNKLLLDNNDLGWPTALAVQGWLAGNTGYAVGLDGLRMSAHDIVELMSMEHADPRSVHATRTTRKAGASISAGPVLQLAYNQFSGFNQFTYDFRADVRHSGQQLLNFLVDHRPSNDHWRIVCHSQGGLLVAVASKLYARQHGDDDHAFAELVSHVAFVAVPFYGTVNAAAALIQGENLSPNFADHFRAIARSWPSLHQMLPVWPGSVRFKTSGGTSNANFNALNPAAWPGLGIDPAMLLRATQTRAQFLNSPLSRMNGVKLRQLMSRAWPTVNHIVIENGKPSLPAADEPGDTLVPADTTRHMQGGVEKDVTHQFGTHGDTLQHFVLCNDPFVPAEVASFFDQ